MDLGRVEYFGTRARPSSRSASSSGSPSPCRCSSRRSRWAATSTSTAGSSSCSRPSRCSSEGGSTTSSASTSCSRRSSSREDITGWERHRLGILEASRQLQQGYHLEFAQRAKRRLGDALTIIDPVDYGELRGVSFYDLFLDRCALAAAHPPGLGGRDARSRSFRDPAGRHDRDPQPRPLTFLRRPRGRWVGLREFAIFAAAYLTYFGVRAITEGSIPRRWPTPGRIAHIERLAGVDWEGAAQSAILGHDALVRLANWVYIFGHWPLLLLAGVLLFRYRPAGVLPAARRLPDLGRHRTDHLRPVPRRAAAAGRCGVVDTITYYAGRLPNRPSAIAGQ